MFALMGISPGVKLEQEIRNPKSVIFNIVQPGQISTANPEPDVEEIFPERTVSEVTKVRMPTPKVEVEEPYFATPAIELPVEEPKETGFESFTEEEINNSSISSRRRRHRFSAADGGVSSLEES